MARIFLNRPQKVNALDSAMLERLASALEEAGADETVRVVVLGGRGKAFCGGVPVYPGDVVVGDAEGVVVIPAKIADEVAAEAAKQTEFEDWVEAKVKEGRSIFGLYPPDEKTRAEFEAWKKKAK